MDLKQMRHLQIPSSRPILRSAVLRWPARAESAARCDGPCAAACAALCGRPSEPHSTKSTAARSFQRGRSVFFRGLGGALLIADQIFHDRACQQVWIARFTSVTSRRYLSHLKIPAPDGIA